MYCSSCGKAVSTGLSYCSRCGAELHAMDQVTSKPLESVQMSLVWMLAVVTFIGIGAVIGLMAVMKEIVHFGNELILGISLLTFLTFLGVDSVIIWLLLQTRRDVKVRTTKERATGPLTAPFAMMERNMKNQVARPISAPFAMMERNKKQVPGPIGAPLMMMEHKKQVTGPISAPFTMMEDLQEPLMDTQETELITNEPLPSHRVSDHTTHSSDPTAGKLQQE